MSKKKTYFFRLFLNFYFFFCIATTILTFQKNLEVEGNWFVLEKTCSLFDIIMIALSCPLIILTSHHNNHFSISLTPHSSQSTALHNFLLNRKGSKGGCDIIIPRGKWDADTLFKKFVTSGRTPYIKTLYTETATTHNIFYIN